MTADGPKVMQNERRRTWVSWGLTPPTPSALLTIFYFLFQMLPMVRWRGPKGLCIELVTPTLSFLKLSDFGFLNFNSLQLISKRAVLCRTGILLPIGTLVAAFANGTLCWYLNCGILVEVRLDDLGSENVVILYHCNKYSVLKLELGPSNTYSISIESILLD